MHLYSKHSLLSIKLKMSSVVNKQINGNLLFEELDRWYVNWLEKKVKVHFKSFTELIEQTFLNCVISGSMIKNIKCSEKWWKTRESTEQ